MQPMPEPGAREYRGTPAAPGLAQGTLVFLEEAAVLSSVQGDPQEERGRLQAAIGQAVADLTVLLTELDEETAGIIEFQIAMLEDDALSEPALESIAQGSSAAAAWQAVLGEQIADYEAAEDEYFRARAADRSADDGSPTL